MGKSKTKTKSDKKTEDKQKQKPRRLPVSVPTTEIMVGMEIVTSTTRDGYVDRSFKVSKLTTGISCRNLHVNDTQCWDRGHMVPIAIDETEALGRMFEGVATT